jgi:hypothetical protein
MIPSVKGIFYYLYYIKYYDIDINAIRRIYIYMYIVYGVML